MKISQILDKIDENQLFVPAFQREYVWKRDDAKQLMSSLVKEYPTGTLLTWETQTPPELKGKWKYNPQQGAVKLILDGQQRITTLYLLIRGEVPPYYNITEITNDTRNLYVNLESLEFQYFQKTLMENNPIWQNITDIFQKKARLRDITKKLEDRGQVLSGSYEDLLDDNFRKLERIPDREFVEQQVPIKASLKEAIDIFYIVNASGVNLTDAELALAQISGYWPQARDIFKAKLNELKQNGYEIKLDFIIYVLLGILHNMGSDMKRLHSPDNLIAMKEAWELLDTKVIDHVINLLRTHAYVNHTKEINSIYALVPIMVYTFHKYKQKEIFTEIQIKKIVKWYYYSQIRQRYVSQTQQKLDKDVAIVVKSSEPFDELLNIIKAERPLEISPDEFIGVDIRNALFSLMSCYFKSKNAVCFTTGVGINSPMGKKYSLEWDHIFPYSVLKENGYNMNNRIKYSLAQEITNRAILTQQANRSKSATAAYDYLKNIELNNKHALELQSIPMDEELWKLENFERFLQKRRELLAEQLNTYLNEITPTQEIQSEITLDELINEGESQELELKTSLRWNHETNNLDENYLNAVIKTIAAFANSHGGTLILGVSDDAEVIGLAQDYSSVHGDREEFEAFLSNLLKLSFSLEFIANKIKIIFFSIDGKDICRIRIEQSDEPLYIKGFTDIDKKSEFFYIRTGTSSRNLPISEALEYIKTNFNTKY